MLRYHILYAMLFLLFIFACVKDRYNDFIYFLDHEGREYDLFSKKYEL